MKSEFCLLLFLFFCPGLTSAQVDLNKGLIGCYPFTGNARDLSSSQNHGKVTGAVLTEDRFGAKNSAYYFDGVDDFIEIDSKPLQLNTFSYSMWVAPASLPGNSETFTLFSVGSAQGDQHIFLANQYTSGIVNSFSHSSYQGIRQNVVCNYNQLPLIGQWYHIVLSKDNDNYYFYVDGELICTNSVKGEKAFYGTSTIRALLAARSSAGQRANAKIDDIHLYDRVLNHEEILELFNGSSPRDIELIANKTDPCPGDSVVISANIDPKDRIEWAIDSSLFRSQTSRTLTILIPTKKSDYQILVKGNFIPDNTACFRRNQKIVQIAIEVKECIVPAYEQLYMPSAFTPNNDGHNDALEILNWETIEEFELYIYNRWGEIIFYSKGYDKPWDGRFKGTVVPNGTYLVKILSNKKKINSGFVAVLY